MKTCTKCKKEFPATIEYFHWRKDSQRYRNECKKCHYEKHKRWAKENKDRINTECQRKRKENPGYYNAIGKKYRDKNPQKRYIVCTAWRKNNPEKNNAIQKKSYIKRRTTLRGNLNHRISVAIQISIKKNKKGRNWESIVGYTLDDLRKCLETQFTQGMSWNEFLKGNIHIDHKTPQSVFNFTKPEHEDFKRCWALSNLQPMWAKENMSKGAKLEKHFQPSLQLG